MRMKRKLLCAFALCFLSVSALADAPDETERLVVYTSHKEEVYQPIVEEFERRTGVWVQVVSGGTTELLLVTLDGKTVRAEKLGGTSDISAGQLIDRTGKKLGLPFPAGKAVDELSLQARDKTHFRVKVSDCTFSFSGIENKMNALAEGGTPPAEVCWYVLSSIIQGVETATQQALVRYPGLPVLCAGGVASNQLLRQRMTKACGAVFAEPRFSTDNAMGVAILTWRIHSKEGL